MHRRGPRIFGPGRIGLFRSLHNVSVKFIDQDTKCWILEGKTGQNLLSLAHANQIELEGACEGSLACSTCHVILDEGSYHKLSPPTDEENDMLDQAFGLTKTSRLGCQVKLCPKVDGMQVIIPRTTRNMAVDGYRPKPH